MSEFDAWKEVANLQAEIKQLKTSNNELVAGMYGILSWHDIEKAHDIAREALAKAKELG